MGFSTRSPDTMTFNAMSQWWTGWLYPIRLTFRRLPSIASGQYYEDHDGVFNRAGSTLAVPLLGPVNGVHLTTHTRCVVPSPSSLPERSHSSFDPTASVTSRSNAY